MNEKHKGSSIEKIIEELPKKLPSGTKFEKLRGEGEPYRCAEWKHDQQGAFCMYYKFSSYEKRVPLSEIEIAVRYLKRENRFDRNAFEECCPISNISGPCGFTVIGRILEQFFGAEYAGNEGFIIKGQTTPQP